MTEHPSAGGRRNGWARRPDGARVAFQLHGPRDAPPLLLLQGQANAHHWWDRLRTDFTATHLTVTLDYRGTGRTEASSTPGPAWSTAGFADDAVAVLSALGIDRADVYGTSMGGRVAQEFALRHPNRLGRLVLACTSPGGPQAVERDREVRALLADPEPSRRIAALADLFYTPGHVERCGGPERVPRDLFGDPGLSVAATRLHLAVSSNHDAWDRLDRIQARTLVLHGTEDRMTPAVNATVIADRIPDASVRLLTSGRHGFFDEFHAEVSAWIHEFLAAT